MSRNSFVAKFDRGPPLMQGRAFAWGHCKNLGSKRKLVEALRAQGLNVDSRSSSVAVLDCALFTIEFEWSSEDEASFEGTAERSILTQNVELVATALKAADVEFWIEITDSVQNPLHYYSHRWPE